MTLNESDAGIADFISEMRSPGAMISVEGQLTAIGPKGLVAKGLSHLAGLEDFVAIKGKTGQSLAEVVFVDKDQIIAKPLDGDAQVYLGDTVRAIGKPRFYPHEHWKGRLISATAEPLDGKGPLPEGQKGVTYSGKAVAAVERAAITTKLITGVKSIDLFTPLCYGQRMGIFAGSGVGKSTLMGMLAASPGFDCAVIALVGERGREVTEFVHEVFGARLIKIHRDYCDRRRIGIDAQARCPARCIHRRMVSRSGAECPSDDGFADALRAGSP